MDRVAPSAIQQAVADARQRGLDREPRDLMKWAHDLLGERLMMTTALQKGGMVLLHMVRELIPGLPVYFLDTGFHFQETLDFFAEVKRAWNVNLILKRPRLYGPSFVARHGEKLYEANPDLCCHLNKTESLAELFGETGRYQGWITGIRRDQASTRAQAETIEVLEGNLIKVQPLAFWSNDEIDAYGRLHHLPQHPLFARGYSSIGCAPCTKPCATRAGRWDGVKKECGIHYLGKKRPPGEAVAPPAQAAG